MMNGQLLRAAASNLRSRSFASGISRSARNPHTNYDRTRHAKGNGHGLVIVGTIAIVAGTASAVAMAYCEEGEPVSVIAMSPATTPTIRSIKTESWRMELECK
jgi:hypothetical protein